MPWNLPNTLTWARIAAIPLIVLLFYMPYTWADPAAGLMFAAAGITDSLDGYFARRLGQISRLGAFLDPVADKLIVAVALVLLVSKDNSPVLVLTAAVIIGREITISALARVDGRGRGSGARSPCHSSASTRPRCRSRASRSCSTAGRYSELRPIFPASS